VGGWGGKKRWGQKKAVVGQDWHEAKPDGRERRNKKQTRVQD